MAYVIREGDPTTTGGKVIAGSSTTNVEYRKVARITDPVWCPVCSSVGYIAEGHHTFIDTFQAVAVEGLSVQCGCPPGSNRLIATQSSVMSNDQPAVPVPAAFVSQAVANTHQWAEAIRQGYPQNEFADAVPRDQVKGLALADEKATVPVAPTQASQQVVEPGFHIVESPMSRSALESALFDEPNGTVLEKFRQLNPLVSNYAKPGQLIVLSDPNNQQCTREEALLMEAAAKVNSALEPMSDEEASFMMQHRDEIESLISQGSTSIGIGEAIFAKNLENVKDSLRDIESLHQRIFLRDGHLRAPEFFTERKRLFTQLDNRLTFLTKKGIGFPDHPNLKKALGISSRSLVHRWTLAGAADQIPGYATHMAGVAKAAKYVKYGGWIGTAVGGGASYMKVQDVCTAGDAEACERVKFTEGGSFIGGFGGGAAAGAWLSPAAGSICLALGVPTGGVATLLCGLVVVGVGSLAGGTIGGSFGESAGDKIYEKSR